MAKTVQIQRGESLKVDLQTEDDPVTLEIESINDETIMVSFNGKLLGSIDMDNFLALCERALWLWKEA